jgi:UDP-N-acetylglucosamine 1-carboxyvinyltransferase
MSRVPGPQTATGARTPAALAPTMAPMQQVFQVTGGNRLSGEISVVGAKNSVLKLMAAALLAKGRTTITNVPDILDVSIMAELLRRLGCDVTHDSPASVTGGRITIDVPEVPNHQADYDLVRRMRASICVLGPLIARCGAADVALPGGDAIGSRGLDMHIAGLQKLGATFDNEHGFLVAKAQALHGGQIWLDFPSVGATENILMAAVLAKGRTVIDNAAREPEIVDICQMLLEMGADIDGVGTSTLTVEGVPELHPVEHRTVPDRIVAGTWAVAAAITGGDVFVRGAIGRHLEMALDKLASAGALVNVEDEGFRVRMDERPRAVDIVTLPYPGFPTDLQPQFIALNAIAEGTAMITENLFEARFRFVNELARLGADVRTDGHHALVRGRRALSGAPVEAADIRAGAGLVLAGLVAQGQTTVYEVHHIERGYPGFVPNLKGVGADIERLELPSPFDV